MANTIELAKKYLPVLDEVYKVSAKTSIFDAPSGLTREAMTANEILLAKVALQGLADYDRGSGFVNGDVTFEWETHTFTQDRGRSFLIDAMDDMETVEQAFMSVAGQFIRTKVVPELDAYRFATIAAAVDAGNIATPATLSEADALEAIDTGIAALENAEVNLENVAIFVTPEVKMYLKQSSQISRQFVTNVGANAINREIETLDGRPLIVVPQTRFYTAITLQDGTTSGQEAGGYVKDAVAGLDINFLIADVTAALGITKTAVPRIFDPMTNQTANAWKYDYRLYHDIFVPDNKTTGFYLHTKA